MDINAVREKFEEFNCLVPLNPLMFTVLDSREVDLGYRDSAGDIKATSFPG